MIEIKVALPVSLSKIRITLFQQNLSTCLVLAVLFSCFTKSIAQENIVPNSGFEKYSNYPLGWFYNGKDFTRVVKYWNSPTAASPDVFGPKVRIPSRWAEKGFGELAVKAGESMVGITTYGCEDGKPHCREYVQIQLQEPLVVGQKYQVTFWLAPLQNGIRCNNIGALFTTEEVRIPIDEPIEAKAQIKSNQTVGSRAIGWQKISQTFTAKAAHNYIVIGNFDLDENTKIDKSISNPSKDALNFGYYYIDEVVVKKTTPIIDAPLNFEGSLPDPIPVGEIIRLNNIFFDHDQHELLPRSFAELNKLAKLLKQQENVAIEIRGHTDATGHQTYNLPLSEKRAAAVANFLISSNINPNRISYLGFGSERPIASNINEEGKRMNRRVEFIIKYIK